MRKDELKAAMLDAMKGGRTVEKNVLRVALGEVQTLESRGGTDAADAEVEKILRKLIKSIGESRDAATDEAQRADLVQEIEVLERFLPKTLTAAEIVAALAPVADAVRAAGNDGQATGVAMKHLKGAGLAVEGKDVNAAVRSLRADA